MTSPIHHRGAAPLWPARNSPAIIVANHQGYLDGPWLAALAPQRILFGVDPDFSRRQPWRGLLRLYTALVGVDIVPMGPGSLCGLRQMCRYLEAGGWVCLFPEGGINTGREWPGAQWLARRTGAPIHRLRLRAFGPGKMKIPYLCTAG